MDVVFLVYGLAFLGLGFTIVIRNDRDSEMEVSRLLWLLAGFAFVHGFLEWTDLWRIVHGDTITLAAVRPGLLLASYLLLYEFGRRLVLASLSAEARARPAAALLSAWVYVPMFLCLAVAAFGSARPALALTVWTRYLPGFAGATLAGIGCVLYCRARLPQSFDAPNVRGLHVSCKVAGIAFVAYGILGGLVVPPADWLPARAINEETFRAALGMPVQLLRAACAVAIAVSVGSLLRVFDVETRERLLRAQHATRSALDELRRINQHNEAILDSAAEGIVGLDEEGRTIFVNDAALAMLGFEEGELIDRSFHALTHHSRADGRPYPEADCPIRGRLKEGVGQVGEELLWRKDGTSFIAEYRATPLRDPELGLVGAVLVFHDIGDRRRNERRIRALLDASPESTLLLDPDGKVLALNRIAAERLGHAPQDMVGRNLFDFLPEDLAEKRRAMLRQVVLVGEPVRYSDRRGVLEFEHNVVPVAAEGGRVESVAVYAKDITEQVRSQRLEAMFHRLDQLQLKWRMGLDAVAQTFCDELRALFLFNGAWIARAADDGALELVAVSGSGNEFVQAVRANCCRWSGLAQACEPGMRALRTGAPSIQQLGDPDCGGCRGAASAAGATSALVLPLTLRGRAWGVLTVYSAHRLFEEPDIPARIAAIASRLCVSLESSLQQEWLTLLDTALSSTGSAVFITDAAGRIHWANASFYRLSGYSAEEVIGETPRLFNSGAHDAAFFREFWRTIRTGGTWRGEVTNARRDGSRYTVHQIVTPLSDDNGEVTHYVSILEDVTDQKAAEERIRHMANFDALTDLANRATLFERLGQALALARRTGETGAVLFLDLDHFKEVNDTLGHEAGDALLKLVAARLLAQVRETDTVARFGGDEFAIILPRIAGADDALRVADKVIAAIGQPFELEAATASIGVSIGMALFPENGTRAEELLGAADSAMYCAKQSGRNCAAFHVPVGTYDAPRPMRRS